MDTAEQLGKLDPNSFVALAGHPADATKDDPSHWHVNKNFLVTSGGNKQRHGIVLQDAEGDPTWLTIVVEHDSANNTWRIDEAKEADAVGNAEDISQDLQVVATADTKQALENAY